MLLFGGFPTFSLVFLFNLCSFCFCWTSTAAFQNRPDWADHSRCSDPQRSRRDRKWVLSDGPSVEAVTGALKLLRHDAEVMAAALGLLGNLACGNVEFKRRVFKEGLCNQVLVVMEEHARDVAVQVGQTLLTQTTRLVGGSFVPGSVDRSKSPFLWVEHTRFTRSSLFRHHSPSSTNPTMKRNINETLPPSSPLSPFSYFKIGRRIFSAGPPTCGTPHRRSWAPGPWVSSWASARNAHGNSSSWAARTLLARGSWHRGAIGRYERGSWLYY